MNPTTTAALPCPRCQSPLIDPAGLGWCKACGYCRSLAEVDKKTAEIEVAQQPSQLTVTGAVVGQTPLWVCVTLIGMGLIIAATWAASHYWRWTPLDRAIFTSGQVLASLTIILVAQFIALLKIAPEDAALTVKDAIFPFRLYALVLKRLPSMSFAIYAAVWGLTAIIAVNLFIGGLGHWLTYLPDSKKIEAKKIPTSQ